MILATMMAILLARQLVLPYPGGFRNERTLGEVLRAHGPPLFTARSATIEQPCWVLWGRILPVRARRLAASDLQMVDHDKLPKLAGRVLIYCEGNVWNSWAKLELSVLFLGADMARATPLMGREGPGQRFLEIGPDNRDGGRYITQTDPIRIILIYVNERGAVDRIGMTRIRELELSYPEGSAR
jgi:hypothetical protein